MKKLNKLIVILLVAVIVLLYLSTSMEDFIEERGDISQVVGVATNGREISVEEYVLIAEKTIGTYLKYLRNGEIDKAYRLLTPEYKEYVSSGDFADEVSKYDFGIYTVQGIDLLTTNMYQVSVQLSDGLVHKFLVLMKEETFAIVPEPFLKYEEVDKEITKDDVTYKLIGYEVDVDKCIFDMTISNEKNEPIKFLSSKIETTDGGEMYANNAEFTVEANSDVNVSLEFKTSVDFPERFELERADRDKSRVYIFEL